MAWSPEQKREIRASRKSQGLCRECASPVVPGQILCENHRIIRNQKATENRRKHAPMLDPKYPWGSYRKRAKEELSEAKCRMKNSGCCICGYNDCPDALHFHHVDEKTKDIGSIKSVARLEIEVKKCIVVCANCHAEIHAGLHEDLLHVVERVKTADSNQLTLF